MSILQNIMFGLSMGSYIAIAAISFTLVYGLFGMINFAHAEYLVIGAYFGFFATESLGASIPIAMVIVLILSAVVGWLIARIFYMPLREAGPIPLLFTSIGVGFVLRNGMRLLLGAEQRNLSFLRGSFRFDSIGVFVSNQQLLTIGLALAVVVALHLTLNKTEIGIAMRALSANEDLAQVTGIDARRLRNYVWIIASGLAGLSGMLIAMQTGASPTMGLTQIILIISAAILGGIGSPYGAVIGSYILGLAMSLSTGVILPSEYADFGIVVAFVVLVGVLLVRPGGIVNTEVEV